MRALAKKDLDVGGPRPSRNHDILVRYHTKVNDDMHSDVIFGPLLRSRFDPYIWVSPFFFVMGGTKAQS